MAHFQNETGDRALDPLGRMAVHWITNGLQQSRVAEVVDPLAEPSARSPKELAEAANARFVVAGNYYRRGDSLFVHARIVDALDGTIVRTIDPAGARPEAALHAIETARQRIAVGLATAIDPSLRSWAGDYTQPPSLAAYHEFVTGLEALGAPVMDRPKAVAHLLRAHELDPTFVSPLIWAASAAMAMNEPARADSLLGVLDRSRGRLTPMEAQHLRALRALGRGDRDAALEASREMVRLSPSSEQAAFQLAGAALLAHHPGEVVRVLERWDPERGWFARRALQYYVPYLTSLHLLGEHSRELGAARRARRHHPGRLYPLLHEAIALGASGRPDEALAILDEISVARGEFFLPPGAALEQVALDLRRHGHLAAAGDALRRAHAWYESRPPEARRTAGHRFGRARVWFHEGRLDVARPVFDHLVSEHPDSVRYLGYAGLAAARQHDRPRAERLVAALAALPEPAYGEHTYWRALIALALGERESALALLELAIAQGHTYFLEIHEDAALETLRGHVPFENLVRPRQ